ncbi:MAG: hypothetical protein ACYTGN_05290 [Planctomycetota bacterium]|jgi:hypothetical protein
MRWLAVPFAVVFALALYFLVGRGDPWTAKYPELPELADVHAPTARAVRLSLPEAWERQGVVQKGDPAALREELARHPGAVRALLRVMIEAYERRGDITGPDRAYDDDSAEAVAVALGESATDADRALLMRVLDGDFSPALRRKMVIALCRPKHAPAVPRLVEIALEEVPMRRAVLFRLDRTGVPPPEALRRIPTVMAAATLARMGDPGQAERVLQGLDEVARIPNQFPEAWHLTRAANRIMGKDIPFSPKIPGAEYARGGPFYANVKRHRDALESFLQTVK